MNVTLMKSMKMRFLSFCNMLKNTQYLLTRHIFALVFVVLIKFIFGIMRSYKLWTWHGEVLDKPTSSRTTYYVDK